MTTGNLPTVAILLTCFNRRDMTLACLNALDAAAAGACHYKIVLVDDGSTDGTADAVLAAHPDATVIRGHSNLYWNQGMRLAWQSAQPLQPDFFMWLNDDTALRPNTIADLLALYRASPTPKTICVGCTTDPTTGAITYGGYKRVEGSLSRLRYRHLHKGETDCDTMNGNCVLFPASAVADIGINGESYSHAFGDIDYGLRAKRAGYVITQLAGPVAQQECNEKYAASINSLTLKNWRFILTHPKGVPVREWLAFCRQFGGILWPVNFAYRYIKMIRAGL